LINARASLFVSAQNAQHHARYGAVVEQIPGILPNAALRKHTIQNT